MLVSRLLVLLGVFMALFFYGLIVAETKRRSAERRERAKRIAELDSLEYQLEQLAEMSSGLERLKALNDLGALRCKRTLYDLNR